MNSVCAVLWILLRILDNACMIKQALDSQISKGSIVEAEDLSLCEGYDFSRSIKQPIPLTSALP